MSQNTMNTGRADLPCAKRIGKDGEGAVGKKNGRKKAAGRENYQKESGPKGSAHKKPPLWLTGAKKGRSSKRRDA